MPPSATRVKASGSEAVMVAAMKEDTAAMESFMINFLFWEEYLEFLGEMLQVELAEIVLLVRYILLFIPRVESMRTAWIFNQSA